MQTTKKAWRGKKEKREEFQDENENYVAAEVSYEPQRRHTETTEEEQKEEDGKSLKEKFEDAKEITDFAKKMIEKFNQEWKQDGDTYTNGESLLSSIGDKLKSNGSNPTLEAAGAFALALSKGWDVQQCAVKGPEAFMQTWNALVNEYTAAKEMQKDEQSMLSKGFGKAWEYVTERYFEGIKDGEFEQYCTLDEAIAEGEKLGFSKEDLMTAYHLETYSRDALINLSDNEINTMTKSTAEKLIGDVVADIKLREHQQWLQSEGGTKADFSGMDLSGKDLSGEDLRFANFSGANLEGANFAGADIEKANFSGAKIEGANFENAKNKEDAKFEGEAKISQNAAMQTQEILSRNLEKDSSKVEAHGYSR